MSPALRALLSSSILPTLAWPAPMILACTLSFTGCSVYMAASQPPKKNLAVLRPGTPRSEVLAELGKPSSSRLVNLRRRDWFLFTQGYSKEARVGRAFAHGTIDIATLGLWELAGTPAEVILSGKRMSFEVRYDDFDNVISVQKVHIDN